MNRFVLAATFVMAFSAAILGQSYVESASTDVFDIGVRRVRVPAPEGFTKIGMRYGHILSVLTASEPANNEIFAVHLPNEQLSIYLTAFDSTPEFYTKVSVSRIGRDEDITPAGFTATGAYIESQFARLTDPNGEAMKAGENYASKNLSEMLDSRTKLKFDRPLNLGVFEKNGNVHSTLVLLNLSANKTTYKFLATISFVYVNERLVYVYSYKADPREADLEMLREFTKKWTASIVAANDDLIAKGR
jgi:hypothetical protein